jgi:hypothetical protein
MANEQLRAVLVDGGVRRIDVAEALRVDPKTVDRWVAGRVPHPRHRSALAELLGLDEAHLWPEAAQAASWPGLGRGDVEDEFQEILRRSQQMATTNVDASTLGLIDRRIADVGGQYEQNDASAIYATVLGDRRWLGQLLDGHQRPQHRLALYMAAGKLSAILGYLAFDRGNTALATAYCDEAFSLAEAAAAGDLAAWVRGMQSFVAYYSGSAADALDLAADGLRRARQGPQTARLYVASARAAGRLRQPTLVARAIDRAYDASSADPGRHEVEPFLSFERMGVARIDGNAASAYLAAGEPDKARRHAQAAIPVFAAYQVRASYALTLVDLATAELKVANPAPEAATDLVGQALAVGRDLRSSVVARRSRDFLAACSRWKDVAAIASLGQTLEPWDQQQSTEDERR